MIRSIKRSLMPVFTFARIDIKRLFRDKVALFFTLIFPLIFLLVFGGLFGRDSNVSFDVAIINQSTSKYSQVIYTQLKDNPLLKVDESVSTLDASKEKMKRGELDSIIVLDQNFGSESEGSYSAGLG